MIFLKLVKLSRIHWHYETNESQFYYGHFFSDKTINSKRVSSKLAINEKNKILSWRKRLLKRIKDCIKHTFIHPKKNVFDIKK